MRHFVPLVSLALGGCFYIDPINQRPSLDIVPDDPGKEVYRGDQHVGFSANADDPEKQSIAFSWHVYLCTDASSPGGCDVNAYRTATDRHIDLDIPMFRVDPDGNGPEVAQPVEAILLVLEGVDERGAAAKPAQQYSFHVLDREPSVTVTAQIRYPGLNDGSVVGTPVGAAARYTDGDDPLDRVTVDWKVFSPTQTTINLMDVPQPPDPDPHFANKGITFTPNAVGQWDIIATVTDPLGHMVTDHKTITVVPDAPPCLAQWAPIAPTNGAVLPLSEPTLFQVQLVADDLDPFPQPKLDDVLGTTRFKWSLLGPTGARTVLDGATGNSVPLDPASFPPGSQLELRVEISDRNATPIQCTDSDQTCSVISTSCIQRQTWHLEVL